MNTLSQNGQHLVQAKGLTKQFAKRGSNSRATVAVIGVDVTIDRGHTLGLVGESGSGKSTLGRLLLGLLRPDKGTVHFSGRDLQSLRSSEIRTLRADMQIVFQNPYSALNPRMKVRDIVGFNAHHAARSRRGRQEAVAEAIRQVGLPASIMGRYPHQLSGGQAQRVGIARAIVSHPKFIVADEVVSALDVSVQAEILDLFLSLQHSLHLTTLFISHHLDVVRYVSDEVAVMHAGRIVELGPTEDVYSEPRHPYTRLLLSAVRTDRIADPLVAEAARNALRAEVAALEGGP